MVHAIGGRTGPGWEGELSQEQKAHAASAGVVVGTLGVGYLGEDMETHRIPADSGLVPAPGVTHPTSLRLSSGCSWQGLREPA